MSGKKNSFTATLYPTDNEKDVLYKVSGQWTKTFDIVEGKKGSVIDTYDADAFPTTPLIVAPIEEQDPMESRRAWSKVADGIALGNMDLVGAEKTKIEVSQRELRQKERDEGKPWVRRYFTQVETDEALGVLGPKIGVTPEADKTGGIWRYDETKAALLPAKSIPALDAAAKEL